MRGQFQQQPAPAEGGMLKRHWWNYWQPRGANLPPVRGGAIQKVAPRGGQPGSGVDSGALVGRTTGVRSQRWSLVRIPRCLGHYAGVTFYRRRLPKVPPTELSRRTRSGSSRRSRFAFFTRTHAPQPGGPQHARMPLLVPAASSATSRTMMTQLTFVLLQLADVVTTMLALGNGGVEQNPLVARFLVVGTLQGLILSKVVLLVAAAAALRYRRFRAIRMANIVFGGIVLWNISVIVRLALRSHSP
jgi:hypothetical protein